MKDPYLCQTGSDPARAAGNRTLRKRAYFMEEQIKNESYDIKTVWSSSLCTEGTPLGFSEIIAGERVHADMHILLQSSLADYIQAGLPAVLKNTHVVQGSNGDLIYKMRSRGRTARLIISGPCKQPGAYAPGHAGVWSVSLRIAVPDRRSCWQRAVRVASTTQFLNWWLWASSCEYADPGVHHRAVDISPAFLHWGQGT